MKIIDLLNKASNYEELPKRIKFNHKEFIYDEMYEDYYTKDNELFTSCFSITELNYEVEIIEPQEHKIPDKIPEEIIIGKKQPVHRIKKIEKKINEIIDYLEEIE